jgi:hypothetical protein
VIYPGRCTGAAGPDFRDAVIVLGKVRLAGDIEVHVRSRDWRIHNHNADPAYNSAILHVVLARDASVLPLTSAGRVVPEVEIPFLEGPSAPDPPAGGCPGLLPCEAMPEKLKEAGRRWFRDRASGFQAAMKKTDPAEVLYRAMARALGYRVNADAMEALARAVPLRSLAKLDAEGIEERLMEAAGFKAPPPSRIKSGAGSNPSPSSGRVDSRPGWRFGGIRPANAPSRRVAALASLINRFGTAGFGAAFRALTEETAPRAAFHRLETAFTVPAKGNRGGALVGTSWARQIVVNAVLPWLGAKPDRREAAEAIFEASGRLEENELTRHLAALTGYRPGSAGEQQGFIYIYREWCREKECEKCLLAKGPTRQISPA